MKQTKVRHRKLLGDCVEAVSESFDFTQGQNWEPAGDVNWFTCPACKGRGNIRCDECKGRGCGACDGISGAACECCEGGLIANRPVMNVIYPLPEGFDQPKALIERFHFVVVVKIEARYFLTYAYAEWEMRPLTEMVLEMIQAFIRLGYLPPAGLACRLVDAYELNGRQHHSLLGHCRQSIATCSRRWTKRLAKFEKHFGQR